MKVRISQNAEADLRQIEEYIADDNPKAALDFLSCINERFGALAQFPAMGRKRDDVRTGYRSITEGDQSAQLSQCLILSVSAECRDPCVLGYPKTAN